MSFTYQETLGTDLDRVRFYLGDTAEDGGPKPADGNFSDAELTGLIAVEGSWQRAVAAGFEALAALWARHTSVSAGDVSVNQSDVANRYGASAAEWRGRFGSARVAGRCGTRHVTRVDAYSDDLDNVTR